MKGNVMKHDFIMFAYFLFKHDLEPIIIVVTLIFLFLVFLLL